RELDVRAVLTGRVMQSADNMIIKVEMVDVSDGSRMWGGGCSCNPAEILDIETQIQCEISEKLLHRLTSEERKQLTRRPTDNVEAYHAYLKGRYCWNKRTDEDVKKAIDYFKKAIDADPTYALAYVGLADSYLVLGSFGIATVAPKEAFPKAREALIRALETDDTLAEAHASLAYCVGNFDWNWAAAEKGFKRALALKPGYATAHHWYGFLYLASMGRLDEAIVEAKRGYELDPLALPVSSNIGLLLYLARRYDEALEQFDRNLEMDRSFVYTHWERALTYEQCGRYDEAIAGFQKAIELSGTSVLPRVLLARTYALCGRRGEARALLDELTELSAQTYVSPYRVAAVYSALGDKNRAFKWLEHAYDARDGWLIWLAVDPVVDSLRSDKRFADLLDRVGLTTNRDSLELWPTNSTDRTTSQKDGLAPAVTKRRGVLFVGIALLLLGAAYFLLKSLMAPKSSPPAVSFEQVTYQSG